MAHAIASYRSAMHSHGALLMIRSLRSLMGPPRSALYRFAGPSVAVPAHPLGSQVMQKWEYATVPLLVHATKQILDNWGEDGWELVQVVPGPNSENLVAYMKRPRPEEQK